MANLKLMVHGQDIAGPEQARIGFLGDIRPCPKAEEILPEYSNLVRICEIFGHGLVYVGSDSCIGG